MNIEQILLIEPRLKYVIEFAKYENVRAKKHKVYWHNLWAELKLQMKPLIGYYADKKELQNSICYDIFYNYLYSITSNTI